MAKSTISNTIDGVGAGAAIRAYLYPKLALPAFSTDDSSEIVPFASTTTDSGGSWSLSLDRQADIVPYTTYWQIEETIPASGTQPAVKRVSQISVGASNATLLASLITPSTTTLSNYLTQAAADARYYAAYAPFLQAGTGAVQRTVQSKLREIVSTADFDTVQHALDYLRGLGAANNALYVPAGSHSTTTSLNATGIPHLLIFGDGREKSILAGTLAAAHPVLDCTGSGGVLIRDLSVNTNATASAGILFAREEGSGLGDEPTMRNVQVNAGTSQIAVAVVSADESHFDNCFLYGGTFYGATDVLGVTSAYATIATSSTGNTKHTITGGALIAQGSGPCLRYDSGAQVNGRGIFFSLQGSGTAYFRPTGNGGKKIFMSACRGEAPGSATNVSVLDVVNSTSGGEISGDFECKGVGPVINVGASQALSGYKLSIGLSDPTGISYFNSGALVRGCDIENTQNLPATCGANSWNNTVTHQGAIDFFAAARAAGFVNLQLSETRTWIDNLVLGGGAAELSVHTASVAIQPGGGTIAAGAQVNVDVTVTGAAEGDLVQASPSISYWDSGLVFDGAYVLSANTVRLMFSNATGSAITTSAGIPWTIVARRFA